MSGNLSKGSMHIQGWARYLLSADAAYRAQVVQSVCATCGAEAGPTLTTAGLEQELDWRRTLLETRRVALFESELAYAAEQSDDPAVRQQLDDAEGALRGELIAERSLFAGSFGEAAAVAAGLSAATPLGGELLVSYAENFARALRAEPKRTNRHGAQLDLRPNLKTVEEALARVVQAREAMDRESRELREAKRKRDVAAEALRAAYVQVGTYYESLFRMAGLDELADTLRPTARRATSVEAPLEPLPLEPIAGA